MNTVAGCVVLGVVLALMTRIVCKCRTCFRTGMEIRNKSELYSLPFLGVLDAK